MSKHAIIRLGDPTSHGGTVLESFSTLTIYGKNAAGVGRHGHCPLCKTTFTIVSRARNYTFMGKNVAVEGMYTSCGAALIATQTQATIDDSVDGITKMTFPSQTPLKEAASENGLFNDKFQLRDGEGQPLKNTEYTIVRTDGSKESGKTDGSGYTHMIDDHKPAEIVAIHIGDFDD